MRDVLGPVERAAPAASSSRAWPTVNHTGRPTTPLPTPARITRNDRVPPDCRLGNVAKPDGRFVARLRATPPAFRVTLMFLGLAIALSHNFVPMPSGLHYALYFIGLVMFLVVLSASKTRRI